MSRAQAVRTVSESAVRIEPGSGSGFRFAGTQGRTAVHGEVEQKKNLLRSRLAHGRGEVRAEFKRMGPQSLRLTLIAGETTVALDFDRANLLKPMDRGSFPPAEYLSFTRDLAARAPDIAELARQLAAEDAARGDESVRRLTRIVALLAPAAFIEAYPGRAEELLAGLASGSAARAATAQEAGDGFVDIVIEAWSQCGGSFGCLLGALYIGILGAIISLF
jgi:hypothetical protein